MKLLSILFIGILFGLSGCATVANYEVTATAEPPPPAEGPPSPVKKITLPRIAKRSYLYTDLKTTPEGYGAYAYLAFTHSPSAQDERDGAVCKAFNKDFPPAELSPSVEKRRAEMVTFWPLSGPFIGPKPRCDQLLLNYDETFGATIAASIGKQGVKGPLLVAWTKPFKGEVPLGEALVLDMSGFAIKDFDRAFGIWRDRISSNPRVWQRHWNLILVRECCRNGLENYGPNIVTVVATMFKVGKKPN